ncbi:ABC transporter permease [Chitinimonas sp.]|uniref:ABC transporter permease n=1 Tax=Chitinimonas sp. TaxID=1934313 RepID=UPI002F951F4F
MLIKDLRIGWRQLWQDPAYSAVVILGLAIGVAVAFILACIVESELTAEHDIPNTERLMQMEIRYRGESSTPRWQASIPMPFKAEADKASTYFSDVSIFYVRNYSLRVGNKVQSYRTAFVDPALANMLSMRALKGDLTEALARPDNIAVSAATAESLFGKTEPVGQSVIIKGQPYRVAAVLPNRADNSTYRFEVLASSTSSAWDNREFATRHWGHHSGRIFLRLRPGADLAAGTALLQKLFDEAPRGDAVPEQFRLNGHVAEVRLIATPDIKLKGAYSNGNQALYLGLSGLAVLILVLAAINYVNLSTVRTLKRQREIGIRKTLGASPARIVVQFLTESMLVALLATGLGLLLAWLVWPLLQEWLGIRAGNSFDLVMVPPALAVGLLTGVLAGLYPAWVACKIPVAQALAGRDRQESGAGLWLRRGLTVLQFSAALGLSSFAIVILLQARYATHINPGFDSSNLLIVDPPSHLKNAEIEQFRSALSHLPGVKSAGRSLDMPGRGDTSNGTEITLSDGRQVAIRNEPIDPYMLRTYGIQPIAGRLLDASRDTLANTGYTVINRSAVTALGYTSPQAAIGQTFKDGDETKQIIGVIDDLRYQSPRERSDPMLFGISEQWMITITLRTEGDPAKVKAAAEALWRSTYPDEKPRIDWYSTHLDHVYRQDTQLARILAGAAGIATLIAGFGLYALAAYSVRRRAREIVIRKLYGAGRGAILALLGREFGGLVVVGALLGLPLAWLAGERYLSQFIDHASIGVMPLLAALLAAGSVAMLATLRHTLTALAMPPSHALQS